MRLPGEAFGAQAPLGIVGEKTGIMDPQHAGAGAGRHDDVIKNLESCD